jgi:2-dehydropantoate 2-reductase
MARIAIIGPGAIGGTVAAWLAQGDRHEVTLCARTSLDTLTVETPAGEITARPRVIVDPAEAGPVDWALVATKTYDVSAASVWLRALLNPATRVAILQNGVEHRANFSPLVPAGKLVPAIVDIAAERQAPGRILQRQMGTIMVPAGEAGAAFVALFADTPIAVSESDDFQTTAWRKLTLNCSGAVNALALQPTWIANDEGAVSVMRDLMLECIAVGRAEGADLPDTLPDEVIAYYRASPPESINSLYADRLAGRPMEIEARNGVIVRLGERHGIPTPVNRLVVALLNAAGRRREES